MVNGLSTDFVFTWFKLDEGGIESLLANPALGVWCNYFSNLNQYNPGREVSMINKVLDTHEDIPFAKAIVAAMKNEDTQLIASKLQKAQFEKWLVDEKTPDTISKMLMDTKAGWMYMSIVREYDEFYKSANKMDELM
ncbi:Secreted RxLR effector peptide protein [Phytophthora cinnamomi]|uniref:Secreted RxLR effector peptide protein n=1 Tax=Phytophthora cinnamomi TaxID=4785 RepID=UPI00355A62EA|nr:Secreted RxLR effector peptide protein [Phytophthora cinnamomi]